MEAIVDIPVITTDEGIKTCFAQAEIIHFLARPCNVIKWRSISFGEDQPWIKLERVLPLIGITPQMLRPLCTPQLELVNVEVPRSRRSLRKPRYRQELQQVELPEIINTFDQLNGFPMTKDVFTKLAKILGKPIKVWREDKSFSISDDYELFTVYPE